MTINAAAQPERRRARVGLASLVALLGLLALAGCGGSSTKSETTTTTAPATTPATTSTAAPAGGSSSGGGSSLSLSAASGGQLEYSTKSLSASAGKVSIDFSNSSPLGHNLTIESSSGQTVGATPTFQGGSKTLSLNLKPGTYKFFCSVPGHRQAGMEGTLVVK